jgi:hypothetical protein
LHQLPGGIRQQPRQRIYRSMGAVRSREGVVDVYITELGERPRELGRVRSFLLVEAKIFEKGHLPRPQRRDDAFGAVADTILGEDHVSAANCPAQRRDQRPEGKIGVSLSLRATEMRHHDYFGAPVEERVDSRREPLDPGRIGHNAVLHRDVQIGAQQHPLAARVDVVETSKCRHRPSLSLGTASRLYRRSHAN